MIRTSRANNRRPTCGRGENGYALIEIVVAMAIVGLVVSLVLPRVTREPGPGALEAKAYEIAALFRDDRNAAMMRRSEVVSRIELDRRIAVSGSRDRAIRVPDSVEIHMLQSEREAFPGGGGIRFYPDGRTSGGVVTLHRGKYGFQVSVNWLTANVEVAPVTATARP